MHMCNMRGEIVQAVEDVGGICREDEQRALLIEQKEAMPVRTKYSGPAGFAVCLQERQEFISYENIQVHGNLWSHG